MHIVHVQIRVKTEYIEPFIAATQINATNSINEPGIARFDVIQQADDPTRFVLVEAYRTSDDQLRHRETAHYAAWRDTVAEMMAEPRAGIKYVNLYPNDDGWR